MFKNSDDVINITVNTNEEELTVDEKVVLDYITKNRFITTKLCTNHLIYGRTKSKEIFNNLISLKKLKRKKRGQILKI